MDFSNYESKLESLESDVDVLHHEQQDVQDRLVDIHEAIETLENDLEVNNLVKKKEDITSQELNVIQNQIQDKRTAVVELKNELLNEWNETKDSLSVMAELKNVGEDVSISEAILNERMAEIENYHQKLNQISDRLGLENDNEMNLESMNFNMIESRLDASYIAHIESCEYLNDDEKNLYIQSLTDCDITIDESQTISESSYVFENMEDQMQQSIEEKTDRLKSQYELLKQNEFLTKNSEGYQLAMLSYLQESKQNLAELKEEKASLKQQMDILQQTRIQQYENGIRDEQSYKDLFSEFKILKDKQDHVNSQIKGLEYNILEMESSLNKEYEGCSVELYHNENLSDLYNKMIINQGEAYEDVKQDCAVCVSINMARIKGKYIDEKQGVDLAKESGMRYTEITSNMNESEVDHILQMNGRMTNRSQCALMDKMGFDSHIYRDGATFSQIEQHVKDGNPISINISGEKLCDILKKDSIIPPTLMKKCADHAMLVTGVARDAHNQSIGIFINDTGGYAGRNNSLIYLSKKDYSQLMKSTKHASSIVCL